MDRSYLKNTLDNIRLQKAAHDAKFAGNQVHKNCLPRFDQAIENLEKELEKLGESASSSSDQSADPVESDGLPQQVGDGMLYNDVEEEIYQVAEGDPDASSNRPGWSLERTEERQ